MMKLFVVYIISMIISICHMYYLVKNKNYKLGIIDFFCMFMPIMNTINATFIIFISVFEYISNVFVDISINFYKKITRK